MCFVVLPFRNSCYYILNFGKLGLCNSPSNTQSSVFNKLLQNTKMLHTDAQKLDFTIYQRSSGRTHSFTSNCLTSAMKPLKEISQKHCQDLLLFVYQRKVTFHYHQTIGVSHSQHLLLSCITICFSIGFLLI